MDREYRIDISTIVGNIAGVLIAPYGEFIAKLHADGRISDAELEGVQGQFNERLANLPDHVQKALNE